MASDVEEDELQSLRTAVLASLKTQSEDSPAVTGEDSDDDDEDLEALRLAALQSLKAKTRTEGSVPSPVPLHGPAQVPPPRLHNQTGFPSHRRHPKRSNLIAINIVREEAESDLPLPMGGRSTGLPSVRGGRGHAPKIDRTVLPNEGRSSTPTKRNDKFSRFDSDSDSEEEIFGGSSSSSSEEEEEVVDNNASSSEGEKEEERDVSDEERNEEKSSDEAECDTKDEKEVESKGTDITEVADETDEGKDTKGAADEILGSLNYVTEEKAKDSDNIEVMKNDESTVNSASVELDKSSEHLEHEKVGQNKEEPLNGKIEGCKGPSSSEHEAEKVEIQEEMAESCASSSSGSRSSSRSSSPSERSARSKSSVSFTTTSSDGSSSRSTSRSRSRSQSRSPSPGKHRKTRSLSRTRYRKRRSCSRSRSRSTGRKIPQSPQRVERRRSQSPLRLPRNRSNSPRPDPGSQLDRPRSPLRSKRGRSLPKSGSSTSLSRSKKRLRSRSQSPFRKKPHRSGRSDSRSRHRRDAHRSRDLLSSDRRVALSPEHNLDRPVQKTHFRESKRGTKRNSRKSLSLRHEERYGRSNLKEEKTHKDSPNRTDSKASPFKDVVRPTDEKLEARKRKFEDKTAKLDKKKVSLQGIVEKTDDSLVIKTVPVEKDKRKLDRYKLEKETRRASLKSESAGSSSSFVLSDSESESETEESRFRQNKKDVGDDSKADRALGLLRTTQVRTNIPDSLDPRDRRRRDRNGPLSSGFPRDRNQRPRDRHRDRPNTRRHSPTRSQETGHRSRERDKTGEVKGKMDTPDTADRASCSPPKKRRAFIPEKESKSGSSSDGNGKQPKVKSLLAISVSPPETATTKRSVSPQPIQDKREIVEDKPRQSLQVKAVRRKVQVKRIVISDTPGADNMDGSDLRVRILQRKAVDSGGEEDGKKKKRERNVKRKISITTDEVKSGTPDPSDVPTKKKSIHERLGLPPKLQRQVPQQAVSRQQIQIKIKHDVKRDLDGPAPARKQSPAPSTSKKSPVELEVRPKESELDARIRLIQQKNAAILQRKKEIEMDKKKYGN